MSQLKDLKKSISDMSTEELFELHRVIRSNRLAPISKQKAKKETKVNINLGKSMDKLSKSQKAALLALLTDEGESADPDVVNEEVEEAETETETDDEDWEDEEE